MLKLLCCLLFESYVISTDISASQWKCCTNSPAQATLSTSVGSVIEVGGLNSYVSGSPNAHRAIILASDIFGYEVTTLRAIADKVAAAGFYVVVPDFFYGDPYDDNNHERSMDKWAESHPSVCFLSSSFECHLVNDAIISKQTTRLHLLRTPCQGQGVEDAKAVIGALRDRGICAIGVAGFCWGGKVAAILSSTDEIQAVVLLHPVNVTVADIKNVEEPIAILGGEFDNICPKNLVNQYKEVLSTKPEVESYVKIFCGVGHGWTTRYDLEDEKAVKVAEETQQEMLDWFIKFIK